MLGVLLLGLLALGGVAAGPLASPAAACSCGAIPTTAQTIASADVVFVGTVVSHDRDDDADVATFEVAQVRRGMVRTPRETVTITLRTSCGGGRWRAGNYLVATYRSVDPRALTREPEGELYLGPCGGSVLQELTAAQSRQLGLPVPAPSIDGDAVGGTAAVAALALLVTSSCLLLARFGRRPSAPWSAQHGPW